MPSDTSLLFNNYCNCRNILVVLCSLGFIVLYVILDGSYSNLKNLLSSNSNVNRGTEAEQLEDQDQTDCARYILVHMISKDCFAIVFLELRLT